jgi:hypothetical protein
MDRVGVEPTTSELPHGSLVTTELDTATHFLLETCCIVQKILLSYGYIKKLRTLSHGR